MNQDILHYQLLPGDQVIVPKGNIKVFRHFAMYLGPDAYATDWMIENNFQSGVQLISADDFFGRMVGITGITRFQGTNEDRKDIVQKALLKLGKPYSLINYNCEHFVTELVTGTKKSNQVQNIFGGVFALVMIGIIFSDRRGRLKFKL